jgi:NAD(P)-dependent dehydrogenase (short-subunit alcohol dehydrogenase family)
MDLRLRGKRALVTGSTAGIGFAIARGLARERAEVIVNGRSEEKVAEAVTRITAELGSNATGVVADLSSAEGANRLLEGVGRVDILITTMSASSSRSPSLRSLTRTGSASSNST